MSMFIRYALATAAVCVAFCMPAAAEDPPENADPAVTARPSAEDNAATQSAQPAAAVGPKAQQFQIVFSRWKEILKQLAIIKEKYAMANDAEKQDLKKRYNELVVEAQGLYPQLSEAVEEAYRENPADQQLEQFMLVNCNGNVKMDNYEEAYRLGKLLLDNQCKDKNLYAWVGLSACNIGKLDIGEKYIRLAAKDGVIDDASRRFLSDMAYMKKAWKDEQKIRAAEAEADDLPRVLLRTNKGDMEIELLENEAPMAVANFISLVEKGFYDGLTFHRVLPGFMAQGGCPQGTGTGGPGYNIPCECYQPNHRLHFRGSLSMAHAGRDTGGSQFFLTFVPTTFLDGKHTVFGRVIKGMDVLSKIQRRDPEKTPPLPEPDEIIEAKVLRKRPHEYKPTKVN